MRQKSTTFSLQHKDRIKAELQEAGVATLGKYRFSGMYLPEIIREDEHIMAAVFGRRKESEGFFGVVEGMLVATEHRVIFVDHRPGYTTMDEFTYDVISGVTVSRTLFNASVTLYTKVNNYHLSFASKKCVEKFADYIEKRLEDLLPPTHGDESPPARPYETIISGEALDFLARNEIGVLSTIERTGVLNGTAVYYLMHEGYLYFITKESTHKVANISGNSHVAFTVFDQRSLETVQLTGVAEVVTDNDRRMRVISSLLHPREYQDGSHTSPVIRMGAEKSTLVYRIIATDFHYTNFIHLKAQETRPPR